MAGKKDKTEKKSLGKKFTYAYLRHVKKWMYCPACKTGRMSLNKKLQKWQCEDCGYGLSVAEFEDDYVFWFCDECDAYLNSQEGFDSNEKRWVCTACGYENDTTIENIKGICVDCGKVIPDSDQTLCVDCRIVRKEKAMERLKTIGIAAGITLTAATVGIATADSSSDESSDTMVPLPTGDDGRCPICDACGAKMTEFDGWAWYTCPECGNRVRVFEDGTTTWERDIFGSSAYHSSRICEYCGESLDGGDYTPAWAEGNNRNGYTNCPHCGRANFEDDDND